MQPDATPTWVAAIGTLLAVAAALFGPGIRAWWSRPRLSLHPDDNLVGEELIFAGVEIDARTQVVSLVVTNHGRRQADDVEAVLTVRHRVGPIPADDDDEDEIPAFDLQVLGRGALKFELSDPNRPTITVPRGSARTLQFVLLGRPEPVIDEIKQRGDSLPDLLPDAPAVVGTFGLWPVAHPDRITWILNDDPIDVAITVTARNAAARTWVARFKAWEWAGMVDEPSDLSGIKFEWLQPPKRTRSSPVPPSPLRAWIARHTPRAMLAEARFKREMNSAREREADGRSGGELPP